MTRSNTQKIIESFFNNKQLKDTRYKFYTWLLTPHHSDEKDKTLLNIWNNLDTATNKKGTLASYQHVEERLGFSRRRTFSKRVLYTSIRIAAIFICILGCFQFIHTTFFNKSEKDIELTEYFVSNGETKQIKLPDNSVVTINSGSSLFYPSQFSGKTRTIYLSGEAKFVVSPNKEKPFIVKTNDLSIEALGTIFNVSSYLSTDKTAASLIEGKIKVNVNKLDKSYILSPSEQISYDRKQNEVCIEKVNIKQVLAWEKGQICFQQEQLYTVIKDLERHYDVDIFINSTNIPEQKITATFLKDESLENVLHTLQQIVSDLNYRIDNNKVYIY